MDLLPYIDNLRHQLVVAAEAGDEDARAVAERLTTALEPAARLALLDALSAATDEITRDLAPGSVEVRLRGGRPDFIVTPPPTDEPPEDGTGGGTETSQRRHDDVAGDARGAAGASDADEGGTSRITLRMPENLKLRAEETARSEGLSANAWLVRAVAAALDTGTRRVGRSASRRVGRNYTGWVR
ncbi:histidine kinase [Streptomonospora salina]|uniref:Histidine kinase n=1 Tax=Streptomonospora salina TaxID=104205 RepID=A0A841ED65_9ACTN|nr:histidine kinase [Streptomonospora salina]MBB5998400.1 hypothetical protein [Streptomonospora salina]